MQHSSEARWFFKGELPDRLVAWFGPSTEPEARSDRYLVFPGCDSVGVKIRDADDPSRSQFEVKAQIRGPRVVRLGPRATARVDEWVKWSAPLDRFPQWADSMPRIGTDMDNGRQAAPPTPVLGRPRRADRGGL